MAGKIASLLVEIGVKLDGALRVEQSLKSIQGSAHKVGEAGEHGAHRASKAFSALGSGLRSVAKLAASAALAFGGIAVGAFAFVKSQTTAIGATSRMSRALGINVVELQRLKWAAKFSGLSDDGLAAGMKRFNATIFDLEHSTGGAKGKGAAAALQEIGLGLGDLKGKSRTAQLGMIGDALNKVGDASTRSAIAAKIFGRTAGPEMMGLLAKGSEGINKLASEAQGLFTEEQAAQASEFNKTVKAITAEVDALKMEIALDLLPTVQEIISSVKEWIHENREWLKDKIHDGVQKFAEVMGELVPIIVEVAKEIGELIKALSGSGGLGEAIVALGIVVGGSVIALAPWAAGFVAAAAAVVYLGQKLADLTMTTEENTAATQRNEEARQRADSAAEWERGRGARVKHNRRVTRKLELQLSNPQATRETIEKWLDEEEAEARGGPKLPKAEAPVKRPAYRGGGGGRKAPAIDAKAEKQGITGEKLIEAILHGHREGLNEQIRNVALNTPRAADIKPTVAVTYQSWNITNNIKSTDPSGASKEVVAAIRNEFRKATVQAAQSLAGSVVR